MSLASLLLVWVVFLNYTQAGPIRCEYKCPLIGKMIEPSTCAQSKSIQAMYQIACNISITMAEKGLNCMYEKTAYGCVCVTRHKGAYFYNQKCEDNYIGNMALMCIICIAILLLVMTNLNKDNWLAGV